MNIAVRYYSRSGNTESIAKAIASACKVWAVSCDAENAAIEEPVDILYVGGALYAYGIDKKLKTFLQSLDREKVKKAAVFSTSRFSKRALDLMRKELEDKGIPVEEESFYVKGRPGEAQLNAAAAFAKKHTALEQEEK